MKRLVIATPDYNPCSGGIKVMQYLAALMRVHGVNVAATSTCYFCPDMPVVSQCGTDDIAVYPDIVSCNPLGAGWAIRYMLFFASAYYHGPTVPPTEPVMVYMQDYLDDVGRYCSFGISEADILELPNIECGEWCFPEAKTIENVFFRGKQTCGELPELSPIVELAISEPNQFYRRQKTLELLRRTKNFYTMDHYTVLEQEAQLCGCNVFRVQGKSRFEPVTWNAKQRLMRPGEDVCYVKRFFQIAARQYERVGICLQDHFTSTLFQP